MKRQSIVFSAFLPLFLIVAIASAFAQSNSSSPLAELNWQYGPTKASIGTVATIEVQENYGFLAPPDADRFMEYIENPSSGTEYILVSFKDKWFATFEFSDVGYVKDNDSIDPDSVLNNIKKGTAAANKIRREKGWGEIEVIGWHTQPNYNRNTKLLEWAIVGRADKADVVNFNTRLLGRRGVVSATLVTDPSDLNSAVKEFRRSLLGFQYKPGESYAEFRQGDRIAEFGLVGLIVGGTAAVAAKSGFGKWIGKLIFGGIAVAFAGVVAFIKRLFGSQG